MLRVRVQPLETKMPPAVQPRGGGGERGGGEQSGETQRAAGTRPSAVPSSRPRPGPRAHLLPSSQPFLSGESSSGPFCPALPVRGEPIWSLPPGPSCHGRAHLVLSARPSCQGRAHLVLSARLSCQGRAHLVPSSQPFLSRESPAGPFHSALPVRGEPIWSLPPSPSCQGRAHLVLSAWPSCQGRAHLVLSARPSCQRRAHLVLSARPSCQESPSGPFLLALPVRGEPPRPGRAPTCSSLRW